MFHAYRITFLQLDLTIEAWNADRHLVRLEELREILSHQKLDALLIAETFLRAHNNVRLPNYVFYRDDIPVRHSGEVQSSRLRLVLVTTAWFCLFAKISKPPP